MTATVVIGAQWGDEGKGKIVDTIARDFAMVLRYQGGNNAGHTVMRGEQVYKFHLLPSGIIESDKVCVLGNGVVIDPAVLVKEIQGLAALGLTADNLMISRGAHLIMPWHIQLDHLQELAKGEAKIGTTGRGIGPAYTDKVSRQGIRMEDLLDRNALQEKIVRMCQEKNAIFTGIYQADVLDPQKIMQDLDPLIEILSPHIVDTVPIIHQLLRTDQNILLEGAQGTLLDLDFGSYPYVTSSSPTAGGACTGSGIAPRHIGDVIGVAKAYTTRVGEGPFPSEGNTQDDEALRKAGGEFGTTTGRPRRCGWLDLPALQYAIDINGMNKIALTKLDVLSGFAEVPICVSYILDGEEIDYFPTDLATLKRVQPVFETLRGWSEELDTIKSWDELPDAAKEYLAFIEQATGVSIAMVGVGPRQDQILTP